MIPKRGFERQGEISVVWMGGEGMDNGMRINFGKMTGVKYSQSDIINLVYILSKCIDFY